jgi:YHS domain-containing protein
MKKSADTSTYFDPVCGTTVKNFSIRPVVVCLGIRYSFCSEGCRKAFMANPQRYLKPKTRECKGWLGRHLETVVQTMAKSGWEGRPLIRRI